MSAGSWVHSSRRVPRPVTQNNLWSWDKADDSRWPYKEIFLPELDLILGKCHWVIDNTPTPSHPAGSRRIFISISLHNDAFHLDQGEMTVLQLWNKWEAVERQIYPLDLQHWLECPTVSIHVHLWHSQMLQKILTHTHIYIHTHR